MADPRAPRTRLAFALSMLTLTASALLPTGVADAQEFRIYTRVYQEAGGRAEGEREEPIARSLTIFHAGKVYDFIDTMGEVIVFEPARRQFTILDTKRSLSTVVDFDELVQFEKMGRIQTAEYIAALRKSGAPVEQKVADTLDFQLDPTFKNLTPASGREVVLSSDVFRYRVQGAAPNPPEALPKYVTYADWMARLNYALYPQALFPQTRVALNAALKRAGIMPTRVQLEVDFDVTVRMRAEHQIAWKLEAKDRELVHHWQTLLRSDKTKSLTFREYQVKVLGLKEGGAVRPAGHSKPE